MKEGGRRQCYFRLSLQESHIGEDQTVVQCNAKLGERGGGGGVEGG